MKKIHHWVFFNHLRLSALDNLAYISLSLKNIGRCPPDNQFMTLLRNMGLLSRRDYTPAQENVIIYAVPAALTGT